MLRLPKWPSSQPVSPFSANSDNVEIVEDNTAMVIETLMKEVEAMEITSDDEVMDINQAMAQETEIKETENTVGMKVNLGMSSTIVTEHSKQDLPHNEEDNSTGRLKR